MRRALGYKLRGEGRLLADFVGYLRTGRGVSTVTTEPLAVAWTTTVPAGRLSGAAHARGPRFRPLPACARPEHARSRQRTCSPRGKYRPVPYIYSEAETLALMAAARSLQPPLRAATFETLIGLLAATGMRVSEATALDRDDVHWPVPGLDGAGVEVRQVPRGLVAQQHPRRPSVVTPSQRDRLCPRPLAPSFFVSTRGTRLLHVTVHPGFRRARTPGGPRRHLGAAQPKLHGFRHSFAVYTLTGLASRRRGRRRSPAGAVDLSRPRRAPSNILVFHGRPRAARLGRGTPRGRFRGPRMSELAPTLERYFTERLIAQKGASAHTISAYADTFRLLLAFARERTGKAPCRPRLLRHRRRRSSGRSWTTSNTAATTACAPATPGLPPCTRFSASQPCGTPSTPALSAGARHPH